MKKFDLKDYCNRTILFVNANEHVKKLEKVKHTMR